MKILALDLGTSSIGWLIRDTDFEGEEQFVKYGVITFNKGVGEEKGNEYSFAAERTSKRRIRRLYQSRKYKLWSTLKYLKAKNFTPISERGLEEWTTYNKNLGFKRKYPVWDRDFDAWIKLDFNNDGKADFESPYQLRKFLAENRLDFSINENRYMLGRALYHIAQHRGFKSSKKVKIDEDVKDNTDIGAEEKKKLNLQREFEKLGLPFDESKTIGQLLADAENFFKKRNYGRIINELHPNITRKMLQQEVETIFRFQFGEEWNKIFKDIFGTEKVAKCSIFWQRPLRSQKSTVGKCTLEKNKFRCPVSRPEFEIFRAWSLINNIKFKFSNDNEWQTLSLDQKNKLFNEVFVRASNFNFIEIKNWLINEFQNSQLILNYSDKTNVSACKMIYYFTKLMGVNWENEKIQHPAIERRKKHKINNSYPSYFSQKNYYNYEDIWHVAFQLDDEEKIENIAREKFRFNDEQIKEYLKLFNNMDVGYSKLSLKAINNINYFLRKGFIYTDAVLLAKIPDLLKNKYNNETEKQIIESFFNIVQKNRHEKLIVNITNNLISEYKINHFYENEFDKKLNEDDLNKIEFHCKKVLGEKTWKEKSDNYKENILNQVKELFQSYIFDKKREYKKSPTLQQALKDYLKQTFQLEEKQLNKLYHPSAIDIYKKLSENDRSADGKLYLQSPKTGSWKNPMAMRALQELRQLINYLIQTDQIDEETKIIVEIPRELNDANKRKAYEIWQRKREQENKEYAIGIAELLRNHNNIKADPNNSNDIEKFKIWFEQCFDENTNEFTEKGRNVIKKQKKKNKNGEEEEFNIWEENSYEKINSSLWFKILKAKDNILEKYTLWIEQSARCIYTGKPISLTQLFDEDTVDIEHTLPYSKSLDNSLENKTVCFKEYNRNIKQKRIPYECPNYEDILLRIRPWEDKIKNIEEHLEFWKSETKRASTKERKDQCIIQKHLWTWELQYWKNKVERFKMKEITSGFVNAQLIDTQIISKYAFHYLKTLFKNVQVQKGQITSDFSKILGLRDTYEHKERDKHYHHAIDALILSIIPDSARLKRLLEIDGEINELEENINQNNENERSNIISKIDFLKKEKEDLLYECRISKQSIFNTIEKIKKTVIVNNKVRKKGILYRKIATGDAVRGQLHKDTFYGKIKLVKRDELGKPLRDENHNWIWQKDKSGKEEFAFVKRNPVDETLKIEKIVDPEIKKLFEEAIKSKSLKEMKKEGGLIYTDKKGLTHRIRHVRCFVDSVELLEIKKQTYLSNKDYKNQYYADNAENIFYALYEDENGRRTFEMLNLFNAIKAIRTKKITNTLKSEDFFEPTKQIGKGKNISTAKLKAVLFKGQKVIFYKQSLEELKEITPEEISKRIYKIYNLEKDGRLKFQHHLEAKPDKDLGEGLSSVDLTKIVPRYRLSKDNFNFAIEGKDFEIKPDGEIKWLF